MVNYSGQGGGKVKRLPWLYLLMILAVTMGFSRLVVADTWIPVKSGARFVLVSKMNNEAVLDKETGLVWEKSPDTTPRTWTDAISYAYNKNVGGRKGWRLPTVEELESLVDPTQSNPALPSGHPFTNVQSGVYWSAAAPASVTDLAWLVYFGNGNVGYGNKSGGGYVWCVRGGQGYDGQ